MNAQTHLSKALIDLGYAADLIVRTQARLTQCDETSDRLAEDCKRVSCDLDLVRRLVLDTRVKCLGITQYLERIKALDTPTRFEVGKYYMLYWGDKDMPTTIAKVVDREENLVSFQEGYEINNGDAQVIRGCVSRLTFPISIYSGREVVMTAARVIRADSNCEKKVN